VSTTCGAQNADAGPDYAGQLEASASLRITDRHNGPGANQSGTMQDTPLPVPVSCIGTADTGIGATCSASTSANALAPGAVQTRKRAIWALGAVQVRDGGSSGVAGAADATLFESQGIFIP